MQHPRRRILIVAVALAGLGSAAPALADDIRVQSTTDTIDAGLKDDVLVPGYKAVQPGDTLSYVGVGTGKALDNARAGLADVVITHAPSLERQFAADGLSLEGAGRAIFYSDYVIVGPRTDPAGVRAAAEHDAVGALERIAAANEAGGPKASFVSRGDNSGTNVQEQLMWHLATTVPKQAAANAGGAGDRDEPGTGGTSPSWYRTTNVGQAASLLKAEACSTSDAPDGNCYTIVDRGTFNRQVGLGAIQKLTVLSESNDAGARGGRDLLINPFSAYIVNPSAVPAGSPPVDVAAARRFLDYLTSPAFQAQVDTYPTATNPAFRGDAFPAVDVDVALPPTATTGSRVSVALTLRNRQPGAIAAFHGQPVQLQSSTDDGATWGDVGAAVPTDGADHVSFAPTIGATARYRVSLGRFQSTSWNAFSPSVQELGTVVAVPTAAAPISQATSPKRADTVRPRATRFKLTRRRLTLRLNEAGSVRVTLARRTGKRVRRGGRLRNVVRYRTVKTVRGTARKAGTVKLTWRNAIRTGTYRVTARSVDVARNVRTQTRLLKLKG